MELTEKDRKEIEDGIALDRELNENTLGPHGAMALLLLVMHDEMRRANFRLLEIADILKRNEIHAS